MKIAHKAKQVREEDSVSGSVSVMYFETGIVSTSCLTALRWKLSDWDGNS